MGPIGVRPHSKEVKTDGGLLLDLAGLRRTSTGVRGRPLTRNSCQNLSIHDQ